MKTQNELRWDSRKGGIPSALVDDERSLAPHPKKRLGQHFLTDPNIVKKIVAFADVHPAETVLEVGAGRGALTAALCRCASKVIALEIDTALVAYLRATLTSYRNLELNAIDALRFNYEHLATPVVVIGNLPYNISTPLLFRFFEARAHITRMILMLQREVAQRLVARPGTKDYGVLSVLAQYFAIPHWGFRVSPSCFSPEPEVTSAVVRLVTRSDTLTDPEGSAWLVRTVRAAFQHRRKTLANAFRDAGFDNWYVEAALSAAGIARQRRAETLSQEEFVAVARAFRQLRDSANGLRA